MFAAHPNARRNPVVETMIKETFYNSIAEYVMSQEEVTLESIDQQLLGGVRTTIQGIIHASQKCIGIRLPTGAVITEDNCPEQYKAFFVALLSMKAAPKVSEQEINAIIMRVMRLESFQALNPKQFILEAMGLVIAPPEQPQYDKSDITPDLIRTTFYNEMLTQGLLAIEKGWLTVEDFQEEDPKVYLTLPAITILEALDQSKQCEGIRLLNNKMVTADSCPKTEKFPELVGLMLQSKQGMKGLSSEQMLAIKHLVSSESDLPEDLKPLQTHELMLRVSAIKNMAIEITRRRVFHEMVTLVMQRCLETLNPAPRPSAPPLG
jgi:hypothetical protein